MHERGLVTSEPLVLPHVSEEGEGLLQRLSLTLECVQEELQPERIARHIIQRHVRRHGRDLNDECHGLSLILNAFLSRQQDLI